MGYNYFKVFLKEIIPKDERAKEMVTTIKKAHKQANIFQREFKRNLQMTRPMIEKSVPGLN